MIAHIPDREFDVKSPRELGSAVQSARKAQGLRQVDLAGAAGVGLRFLIELEAGKPTAQVGKIFQVVQALGLDMELKAKGRL